MSHTPGPWAWYDDDLHQVSQYEKWQKMVATQDYGNWVVSTPIVETDSACYGPHGDDRPLIAAAPDMLAVLKDIVGRTDPWNCVAAAKAVIAKAEGK